MFFDQHGQLCSCHRVAFDYEREPQASHRHTSDCAGIKGRVELRVSFRSDSFDPDAFGDCEPARRRSAGAYAWRTQLNAGARLAFGSDAPVETFDPLAGIHAAVTRRRADGSPGLDGWYPEQRLSVHEAVYAYSMGAAYAAYEEQRKGSLTPGKLADLVVLDRDIFQIDAMELLHTKVLATLIDGRFVWRDPFFV